MFPHLSPSLKHGHIYSIILFTSHPNSCLSLRCILFPHWKCVHVCVCACFKAPNETLSEPRPAPLATIMTTLLRTIGCQQNKTVVCSAVTLWVLRQKKPKEKSEIKLWLYSGRGTAEVFSSFLLAVFLQLLHCCMIAMVAMRRTGRPYWSAVPLRQLAGGFKSKEKT